MHKPFHHTVGLLFLGLFATAGCGNNDAPKTPPASTLPDEYSGSGPIHIVCTTNIIKDLVQQIGGSRVSVTAIMDGPSVDPHTYTSSPNDINTLTSAELIVYSGLHLEGRFNESLESLEHRGIPVICVTDGLRTETPSRLIRTTDGAADPHVWFDPELWGSCGQWLSSEMSKFDPTHAGSYTEAATAFARQMSETKSAGAKLISAIPPDRRVLVTAHDAFEYFARAFDFQVQAVQGISTESEPGVRRVNELIDLLVSKKIAAVFTEQSVSEKNIEALVAGCEAKGHQLTIGAKLFSDTAGAAGTAEATLSGALLYNIRQISAALNRAQEAQP